MDSKKIIETLVKIAEKQQKAIEKLAQIQTAPQHMEPAKPELNQVEVIKAALPPAVLAMIQKGPDGMVAAADRLDVKLGPGATQSTVTTIQNVVNQLASHNKLPFVLKVNPV
jgi:vacuolar-type H+-ATPase catalytic subunit A/Vma1